MGLGHVIDSNADFSGFVENPDEQINFDEVIQKAKISVDEDGATAAAASIGFSFRSSRPLEPIQFHCNHPFIFFIYDHKNRAVLFTGVYRTPE
jgi:serpin B